MQNLNLKDISRVQENAGDFPPPLPQNLLHTAPPTPTIATAKSGRKTNALRLPGKEDLSSLRGIVQVLAGTLCGVGYLATAFVFGRGLVVEMQFLPAIAMVFIPLIIVGFFVWLFKAQSFGRGFVFGVVLSVLANGAYAILPIEGAFHWFQSLLPGWRHYLGVIVPIGGLLLWHWDRHFGRNKRE